MEKGPGPGVGGRKQVWDVLAQRTQRHGEAEGSVLEGGDFCVSDLLTTPPIPRLSTSAPLRLSQPSGVPRAQQRRALGPRGERREWEVAAAAEPGGPGRSIRLGLENFFFLITSPSRSARVARRGAGAATRLWAASVFLRDGPSWIPGLGYRGEVGRLEGGGEFDSGTGIPNRGWRSTGSESTAASPSPFGWVPRRERGCQRSRGLGTLAPQSPSTYRQTPAEWYAARCVPGVLGNKAAWPGYPLGAASAFTAAEGKGLRQRVSPATWRLAGSIPGSPAGAGVAAGLPWGPPGPAMRSCFSHRPSGLDFVR